jgi:alpha-galactosidase
MRTNRCLMLGIAVAVAAAVSPAWAVAPTAAEIERAHTWAVERFGDDAKAPTAESPFSFKYGGQPSAELLKTWKLERTGRQLDDKRTERTLTWSDPKTGLVLRCVAVEYRDFPTVEWTLYFKNASDKETPILADIEAIDLVLRRGATGEFTLHRTVGDGVEGMYRPDPIALGPGQQKKLAPFGGRPSSNEFPYFNVESPAGGLIVAIGWPGQWSASFSRDAGDGLRIAAGQELTHFKLLPGEEVRSPLVVTQFYDNDRVRAQNLWRRWMIAHNTPRPGGKPIVPQMNVCNGNQYGLFGITDANQRAWIDRYKEEGIAYDYWWCDLGWFKLDTSTLIFNELYDPNPAGFPNGLKALSEYLHARKIKLIAWFEPEHLYPGPGNWICDNHPEWLLKAPPGHEKEINQGMPLKDRRVVNLGNPEALKWVTDNVDRVIRQQGIDYYRHDFNVEPILFWRNNDAPDRQGITEIKYVTGFLAFYDELRRRHPGMLIDNCASGGRRNDVETLRRSVPLLRSDTWGEPVGQQCQTYGLASWIPFWGTGIVHSDPKDLAYIFRSQMGPSYTSCWDLTAKGNYDLHRKLLEQWRNVREHILYGDYYPLSPYSAANNAWMVWQYDRPEQGEGVLLAFRRAEAEGDSFAAKLQGLDENASYEVKNLDDGTVVKLTGKELAAGRLSIKIGGKPGSAVLVYRKGQ